MADLDSLYKVIEANEREMVELERILTSIPALSPKIGGEGEIKKCLALEDWLKKHGITRLTRYDAPDPEAPEGIRPNLVAEIPGRITDSAVWIMAHLDVVPEGERSLWDADPWTVVEKDGKLYGRGVEDNQQGLVSAVFAALALVSQGIQPERTVKLLFVADEEEGSAFGIEFLLNTHKLFGKDDLILVPDSGDPQGVGIEVAEKNILWLELCTHGKQSHGSRPDEGANAHLAGCALALSLHDLEKHFDGRDELFDPPISTFQPTKKEANVPNINTIPGEDVFFMDCRILPRYSLDTVRSEVERRVRAVEKDYGVSVEIIERQAMESPATAVDAPVVQELQAAIKAVYGVEARPVGIGGGTVAGYLRRAGLSVAVWARIEETAHQPNEYVRISNLKGDAKVFATIMCSSLCTKE